MYKRRKDLCQQEKEAEKSRTATTNRQIRDSEKKKDTKNGTQTTTCMYFNGWQSQLSKNMIENYFKKNQRTISIKKKIESTNEKWWKTVFITTSNDEQIQTLNIKKRIIIGYAIYKVSKNEAKDNPICYKCIKIGHEAKICHSKSKCRFCTDNHDSRNCTRKEQRIYQKCKRRHKEHL